MKTNQELRALPEVRSRKEAKNPLGLYLPFSQRAEHCQLHKAELTTIPDGIKQGWPTHIEFNKLHSRIKRYQEYLEGIRLRRVPSLFFDQALDQYRVLGPRKARGFTNDFATFQVEQPGYYGMQGLKHIIQALNDMFKPSVDVQLAPPLNNEFFLQKALVPEVARCLIAEDLGLSVSDERVMFVLEDSRLFGSIVFPNTDQE
ncbi:hypothetical protein KEM48_002431 [Puccinia striiformis f. sp. tritici PST-130]|uniref:Restriction of telomere capping protein 4 n=1 Tax=Puccinia striiformis f. sp. tritici PST-78 TaxID=1165861 RepID=A0A0L0VKR7_9BASI|nr:hypothetical protein KEM48_002431 [Puccinia striiformis f. sp. tritici PST-130]KNE99863.1 hypothetical protein PSTG_06953 [Puccinia striiformis f. sp. tritici PST-78]